MTRKCAIVGATGCGKTLLFWRMCKMTKADPDAAQTHSRSRSNSRMYSGHIRMPYKGGTGAGSDEWTLIDTPALHDSVQTPGIQAAGAATLRLLISCDAVIHVIDASRVGRLGGRAGLYRVDRAIHHLIMHADWPKLRRSQNGVQRPNREHASWIDRFLPVLRRRTERVRNGKLNSPVYIVAANKMDLPWSRVGHANIQKACSGAVVLPLSARRGDGIGGLFRHLAERRLGQ